MFKNKTPDGKLNCCGRKIAELRTSITPYMSQRKLADQLQLLGVEMDKNAIQKIECGKRFVNDSEIAAISKFFGITPNDLLDFDEE